MRACAQDADLVYLTGLRQPGALAAISSAEGSGKGAFTLFVPDASSTAAQWEGPSVNAAAAEEVFGANAAFPMSQVPNILQVDGSHLQTLVDGS